MADKRNILDKETANQKIKRMALEVAENLSGDETPLIIIGIKPHGLVLADKIGDLLQPYMPGSIKIISFLVNKEQPEEIILSEQVDFDGNNILLVDDVCNSGRTLLYALKPLLVFHPKRIQIMVLVERMHKLFPVKPDYVGLSLATTFEDFVQVDVVGDEITGTLVSL